MILVVMRYMLMSFQNINLEALSKNLQKYINGWELELTPLTFLSKVVKVVYSLEESLPQQW